MKFREYLNEAVRLPPKIEDVKMTTLYTLLHTSVTKKSMALPSTAPVVTQMLDSLNAVEKKLKPHMKLTGIEAYNKFAEAVDGHFTTGMPPMSTLVNKYKVPHNRFGGNLLQY